MTIEDDLGIKGRMRTQPNVDVAPVCIHDVKRIMIHIRIGLFFANVDLPVIEVFNLHHRGWSPVDEDAKNTLEQRIFGDILLGNVVLAITGLAINQWNLVFLGIGTDATAEATGKAHQVGVVKILIATGQPAPPGAEAAAGLSQDKVCVDTDAIDAIICAVKMLHVVLCKRIVIIFMLKRHSCLKTAELRMSKF